MSAVEVMTQMQTRHHYEDCSHSRHHDEPTNTNVACPECREVGTVRRLGRCMTCVDCGWSACTR